MKPLRLNVAIFGLCSALILLAGCQHKKTVPIVPQQAPPTAAAEPSPTPEQPAATDQNQEQAATATPTPADQTQTTEQKDKQAHPKKPSPRKPATANTDKSTTEARNTPQKRVIPAEKTEPTPSAGQISPGPTPSDTTQQASTEQLLQSAEFNLNRIKRQLSKDEEAMRAQAKEFISQSRKAIGENDPARAHILAVKAQLLSVELTRQP